MLKLLVGGIWRLFKFFEAIEKGSLVVGNDISTLPVYAKNTFMVYFHNYPLARAHKNIFVSFENGELETI